MLLILKNLLFTVLIPGSVAVYIPLWLESDAPAPDSCLRYVAIVPFVAGAAIYLWCVWDFAKTGGGTPAPIDAPKRLVVRGLYHVVRNPMYVGVLSVILGHALWFGSWLLVGYAVVVWSMFQAFIVFYEEPALSRDFGAEFERFRSQVPRWIPRRCYRPTIIPVTDRVHCLLRREYLSCCYVVRGARGVTLVDTGIDPDAREVIAGLSDLGLSVEDVERILLTHWHNDHSSGAARIQALAGAEVYCHGDAVERLLRTERARGIVGWIARQIPAVGFLAHLRGLLELAPLHPVGATRVVGEGDVIDGFEVLETPGHEDGHVSFFLREEGVLFAGDALAVAHDRVTFMSRVLTKDTEAARTSMLRCLDLGATAICPGHRYPLVAPSASEIERARRVVEGLSKWPLVGC